MTIERRLAHTGFTLTRDYPVPSKRVWDPFAVEDQKMAWYGAGDTIESGEWAFDFRVGGRCVDEGTFHNGSVCRYEATYTDIVEHVRNTAYLDLIAHDSYTDAVPEREPSPTRVVR
ncbi:MAG: ATPase [Allobranchiibius sp.]